jgi:hypothetical protein
MVPCTPTKRRSGRPWALPLAANVHLSCRHEDDAFPKPNRARPASKLRFSLEFQIFCYSFDRGMVCLRCQHDEAACTCAYPSDLLQINRDWNVSGEPLAFCIRISAHDFARLHGHPHFHPRLRPHFHPRVCSHFHPRLCPHPPFHPRLRPHFHTSRFCESLYY